MAQMENNRCNGCKWLWDGGGDSYWYSCMHPDGHWLEEIGGWFGLRERGREPIIQRPEWCPLKRSTNFDSAKGER